MANTKVTGDLIASSTIATGNIADNAVTSDKISGITTAHITEGSNLYYTDARADARVALVVDSAPSTLNTLNELADALGDDPNFATTTATSIGLKAPLASPSFTGNATFAGDIIGSASILNIKNNDIRFKTTGAETMLRAVANGSVELMYNNSVKIATTSTGVTFSNLSNTSATSSSVDEIKIGTFGAGRPAIYFGSSNTTYTNSTWFIENIGAAGKLRIGRNGLDVVEIFNDGNTTFAGELKALGGDIHFKEPNSHTVYIDFPRTATHTNPTARIMKNEPAATHTSSLGFYTSNASGSAPNLVRALYLDENQNATFAGDVGIGVAPTKELQVNGEALFGNGTDGLLLSYSGGNSSGIIDTGHSSTALEFRVGNTQELLINGSSATFGGDLTMSSGAINSKNLLFSVATLPANNTPSINLRNSNNEFYWQMGTANALNIVDYNYRNTIMGITQTSTTIVANPSAASIQNPVLFLKTNVAGYNAGISFINTGNTNSYNDLAGIASFIDSGNAKGRLEFWTRNTDGANTDVATRMTIKANGDVGIATDQPTAKLDVNGTVRYRGSIYNQLAYQAVGNYAANTWHTFATSATLTQNGIYIIVAYIEDFTAGGGNYYTYAASTNFYWSVVGTNRTTAFNFPPMLGTGHATGVIPSIRITQELGTAGAKSKLQWQSSYTYTNLQNAGGKILKFDLKRIGG